MKEIINSIAYSAGQRIGEVDFDNMADLVKKGEFIWIGLHEPSEETLEKIQAEFKLHELAIEDAHKAHQRPKIEIYGNSLFVVLRTAQINSLHHVDFGETHIFVGDNFMITVRHGASVPYTEVRDRCESLPELLGKGQGFALYAVMDFIVDKYYPVVQDLEMDLANIEDKIFKDKPSKETTELIYQLKRELLEIKRAVSPLIDVCNRLMRFDIKYISEETRPYFRDVYDNVVRINEMIENTRELLNTALDANFSLLSILQNDISKKFAGWAAIIALPTMIAGFYGMNFRTMPNTDWAYGFYAIIGFTIVSCVFVYFLFKRSGWI
ncbi:magnesium/cobalt transporter CorA [Pedobacter nototheniae]|uniref:magnesium/cobalt transporter CorA n=1 Tax=Pedobacter nototheniae TaxID=2488994 RepID=UPI00103CBA8F|nr:magnesium/cobalt transporter CorA [Pedobacter nototheniae]